MGWVTCLPRGHPKMNWWDARHGFSNRALPRRLASNVCGRLLARRILQLLVNPESARSIAGCLRHRAEADCRGPNLNCVSADPFLSEV